MQKQAELYLSRSENELIAANVLFTVSQDEKLQTGPLRLERRSTFYSNVISNAYYSIFYAAKALLIEQGIRTDAPNIHIKTIEAFENHLVKSGKLDVELLLLYKKAVVQADELMGILSKEKGKRGAFTYKTIPTANIEPAKESLENASFFFKHILGVLRRK